MVNTLKKEEVKRPSIIATLLWAFGIFIIGLTVYSMITWEGGVLSADLQGSLLIFISFSSAIKRNCNRSPHRYTHHENHPMPKQ